jgi:hypothetical protein
MVLPFMHQQLSKIFYSYAAPHIGAAANSAAVNIQVAASLHYNMRSCIHIYVASH